MKHRKKIRVLVVSLIVVLLLMVLLLEYSLLEKYSVSRFDDKLSELESENLDAINSYLSEIEKDTIHVSELESTKSVFKQEQVEIETIIENIIEEDLEIITREIRNYVILHDIDDFEKLMDDEKFKDLVSRKIGDRGYVLLYDPYTMEIYESPIKSHVGKNIEDLEGISIQNDGRYVSYDGKYASFNSISAKSLEMNVGIAVVVFSDQFSVSNASNYEIDKFLENEDYLRLLLVSNEGQVVFSSDEDYYFLGQNLEWKSSIEWINRMYLGLVYNYHDVKNSHDLSMYGPFIDDEEHKFVLSSMYPVFDENEEVMGYAVLIDDMDKILKSIGHNGEEYKTLESYLVNSDLLLVSPLKRFDYSILVQTIDTESTTNCFDELTRRNNREISIEFKNKKKFNSENFENYIGDHTVGRYAPVYDVSWCLMTEVNRREVINNSFNFIIASLLISAVAIVSILVIINTKKKRRK